MLLRVRSGNRPSETAVREELPMMDEPGWERTRDALREMERKLCCSKCMFILKDPVCLGGCEHVFCWTCVNENLGNECPLCNTPAWVRDVQVNRQLDNMIQLCAKLRNLLSMGKTDENKMDLCQDTLLRLNPAQEKQKKKQIKMWFSPRSRKVRCVVEKKEKSQQISSKTLPQMASYEFVSDSPDGEPAQKKPDPKPRKRMKKKLKDINAEWGVDTENEIDEVSNPRKEHKSGKSVSFCSSAVIQHSPEVLVVESSLKNDTPEEISPNWNKCGLDEPMEMQSTSMKEVNCPSPSEQSTTLKTQDKEKKITTVKRKKHSSPIASSKRPRRRSSDTSKPLNDSDIKANSPEKACKTVSPHKPSENSAKDVRIESTQAAKRDTKMCSTPLPCAKQNNSAKLGQKSTAMPISPNNLTNVKRNYKGETMLHLASIKGDIQGVEDLLNSGANPNVKDNAGWTPLHEACNLGHTMVVQLLLQHHALMNTTGYQNDTPLHDAVKNGHIAIVKLLLSHGASRDAVNIFGLQPVDYAETEEMKSVLLETQTERDRLLLHPCLAAPQLSSHQRKEEAVVLIASGLLATQRADLTKLAKMLKASICAEYDSTVTHVIVSDEPVLRTMKCMMGILAGCWTLQFSWVKACLQSCNREPEESYEIPHGPHRARLNGQQMLPQLLDGCHFYFLGCFTEHRKEDLIELVKAAGGQILIRQPKPDSDVTQTINTVAYHAEADSDQRFCTQYIVFDRASKYRPERVRQGKVWFAPSSWIIECITSFQLLPVH
ncbi:BRCA1 associated RING domain 1 L homeolog [Xenopus laevis]|uniref:BRCA1 associated RING domain 1 L homeolog n=1 Tax=Xenopus laevis TaxID=8355 RepID=Q90X95_XENLA|nr:BRCA1 associated RING domain 1 L homeolog [Xenopus laevis]AAL13038.1 BRCA1-associated RING domain protein [Xenopus laevis]